MDKLKTLRFFVSVSERGSFVETARAFGASASAISKAMSRLEQDVGSPLFIRTTRALQLTDAGRQYLLSAKKVLTELDNCEANLQQHKHELSGTLRMNIPVSYGRLYIRPLLAEFCAQHPNISLDVIYDDAYVDVIEKGIDVTIRSGSLMDNRLVAKKLSPMDFLICAPKSYFDERPLPQSMQVLADLPWINFRFKQTGKVRPVILPHGSGYKDYMTRSIALVDDGESMAELCADGLGLIQVPHFIARKWILCEEIKPVYTPYTASDAAVYALYAGGGQVSLKVKAFVNFVQAKLAEIGEHPDTTWARSL